MNNKTQKRNILLVEDEIMTAEVEELLLKDYGYNVKTVDNGEKAIETIQQYSDIDLILMDIDLGQGIDGTEAAQIILQDRDIPIVFLSSHSEPEIVEKTEKITSYGYILKGSSITVIDASIKMAMKLFKEKIEHRGANKKIRMQNTELKKAHENIQLSYEEIQSTNEELEAVNEELRSTHFIKSILDTIDALVYISDMQTYEILFINDYGRKQFGDVIGKKCWKSLQTNQNGPCPFCTNNKLLDKNGKPTGVYHWEFKNTVNNHWYDCRDTVIKWFDGHYVRMEIATDITKSKQVQIELKNLYNEYFKVFNSLNDGLWIVDMDANILKVNNRICELLEYTEDELLKIKIFNIENESSPEVIKDRIEKIINIGFTMFKVILTSKTGKKIPIEVSASKIQHNGKTAILAINRDITDRIKAFKLINESEIKFRELFENHPDAVLVANPKTGMIIDANNNAQKMTGYSLEQLKKMHQKELHPNKSEASENFKIATQSKPGLYRTEFILLTSDKKEIPIEIVSGCYFNKDDNAFHIGVFRDITERKNSEKKIKSLLSEKEMLLNETHHRIKNNMNVIRSILSIEASMQDNNTNCKKILGDCANRLMSMTVLYDYLYKNEIKEEVDISFYIKNLFEQFMKIYKHLSFKTAVNIDEIYLKPKIISKIGIIINELFTNSVKFGLNSDEESLISISVTKKDNIITIVFSDNGTGLPDSVLFENASSFGLQLINMLVQEIGGTIKTESNQGTKYIIEFKC